MSAARLQRVFVAAGVWSSARSALAGRHGPRRRPLLAVGLDALHTATLRFPRTAAATSTSLRLTIAVEDREPKRLRVSSAVTRQPCGELQADFADPYQVLDLPLSPAALAVLTREGVHLQLLAGSRPLWLFAPDPRARRGLEIHTPHLLRLRPARHAVAPNARARSAPAPRLPPSLASLQAFSWKEGIVLDGLLATGTPAARRAFAAHLRWFGEAAGTLVYEDPRNRRVRNRFYGIEGTLPIAPLALWLESRRHSPARIAAHPWVRHALRRWREAAAAFGAPIDEGNVTAEGAYTVAYPLAVLARTTRDPALAADALALLRLTHERLVTGAAPAPTLWLRHLRDGSRTFPNWARGVAWFILGYVQSLGQLFSSAGDVPADVLARLRAVADLGARTQLRSGLWPVFLDDPELPPDTAGSAGLAAAFALGARRGLLPSRFLRRAARARLALSRRLTPDGLLTGCAQSNKGGESLQRSPYRVVAPYATGLLALLDSAQCQSTTLPPKLAPPRPAGLPPSFFPGRLSS